MLVNTASDCGYTNQLNDLQKLSEQYSEKLVIIGFPANDFKEQEKGTDEEIAKFCKVNYGVSFPLMKKHCDKIITAKSRLPMADRFNKEWMERSIPFVEFYKVYR